MLVLVAYDISENKSRNNLIKRLRYFGLYRIQKSLFAGNLTIRERFNLIDDLEIFLSSERDNVMVFPVCESCKDSYAQFSEVPITLPEDFDFKII